ncbi:MAG TPA: hypothetical protein VKH42_04980 [Vicinamibacterales bacterium]|nr:hypothetical protein [Vicinamibacterales bacterium]
MDGCPDCGSQRLKSAPLPLVGPLLRLVSSKRRYCCGDCRWIGWRHRLARLGGPGLADQVFDAHKVRAREMWYFAVVTVVFVLFLGAMLKQCSDEAPIPPDDISWFAQPSAAGHQSSPIEIRSLSRLSRI